MTIRHYEISDICPRKRASCKTDTGISEKIGITCEEMKDKNSRKLIFTNEELKLRFFLMQRDRMYRPM